MNQSLHERSTYFDALLEHLDAFDGSDRERLAELYSASSAAPVDIAHQWCKRPDEFIEVVEREVGDTDAWRVIDLLAQEHDLPVELNWVGRKEHKELIRLGLMKPAPRRVGKRDLNWIPGAVAAILAPRLSGTRPTVPVLVGSQPREAIDAIAAEHGISTDGSRVEVVLRIAEAFADPEFVDTIVTRLPHPDWIGGAMMTLELGGICYWREIFGQELEDAPNEGNVVPLMRSEERHEQREIAACLLELGIVYRVEEEGADLPLVAVPEELWLGLWTLGQGWLLDWTSLSFTDLEDVAIRQSRDEIGWDAQAVCKWLICEAQAENLWLDDGEISVPSLDRLDDVAAGLEIDWDAVLGLADDLHLFKNAGGVYHMTEHAGELLDLSRQAFVREVLSGWAVGIIGSAADPHLPLAVGLDEQWREHLVELFDAQHEGLSPWMEYEGIEHMETGAGCLREIMEGDEEFMLLELGLTNTFMCISKVHWLDLLSLLETDTWYSVTGLRELLQMVTSYGLFSQIGHIVQDPQSNYYFPVQRPSFLTLPNHTDAFGDWLLDVITALLEPLGLAELSEDGERVWLDTRRLRIPTPPEWPDQPRVHLVREVLGEPELDFAMPDFQGPSLHSVPEHDDEDLVSVDLPLTALLQACEGREIVGFDGKMLRLE